MHAECLHDFRLRGEQILPIQIDQKCQLLLVEMLGLAEHQIRFQVLVQNIRLRGGTLQALLEFVADLRQQT